MNDKKEIIIFKNDAVGDLTHSLAAINSIIKNNKNNRILIYLSNRSKKFSFLINHTDNKRIIFKYVNYDLTLLEKIKIFLYIKKSNIDSIYILAPKNFYFFLPLLFRKIKFIAICVNGSSGYKRPNEYLRKFLYKFSVNNRDACFKRDSASKIQYDLVKIDSFEKHVQNFKIDIPMSDLLKNNIPNNYAYFHIKKDIINKLCWSDDDLDLLFCELLKKYRSVIITRDIEEKNSSNKYEARYNYLDFKSKSYKQNKKKIYLYDNIEGTDLYNVIIRSTKVIAFHGMMTNLASLEKIPVLDLFYCKINNWNDYKNYRNSFYEFKPNYKYYDFTIPKKSMKETLNKMKFSLKK